MNKGNLAKGLFVAPAITAGVDLITNSPVGETIGMVKGLTSSVLDAGNSLVNPLFAGGVGAGFLSNNILKEFDWMESHKKTKWLLNLAAGGAGFMGGTVAAPYILTGSIAYWAGHHGWEYGKEAVKRTGGAAWGLTGGVVKGAISGGYNSVKAGLKGTQTFNPVIS